MCGGDEHLAWKHPISLEACKRLHTVGRVWLLLLGIPLTYSFYFIEPPRPCRLSLVIIRISFLHVGASVGCWSHLGHKFGSNIPSLRSPIGVLKDQYTFGCHLDYCSAL